MAEAMMNDDYRSSHQDLQVYEEVKEEAKSQSVTGKEGEEGDKCRVTTNNNNDNNNIKKEVDDIDNNNDREHTTDTKRTKRVSRSVVFQPPPKQMKMTETYTPEMIVNALNSGITQNQRLAALHMATTCFDHNEQDLHTAEIEAGADIALTKHLIYLDYKFKSQQRPPNEDQPSLSKELSLTCEALEMVLRAPSESVEIVFDRLGTDLICGLVRLIDEEIKARLESLSPNNSPEGRPAKPEDDNITTNNDQSDNDSIRNRLRRSVTPPLQCKFQIGNSVTDTILKKVTRVLGHFARVAKATKDIAHIPGFLGSMLNLINLRPYNAIPWEARLSSLWTIANLACNTDNMQMMLCTPTLINSLVGVACRPLDSSETMEATMDILRSRSIASRALLNLSYIPENKIPLADNLALVGVLAKLAVIRHCHLGKSMTVQDILLQTRRHAVGAIRNIAAAPSRCKILLCEYREGRLLDVLTDAALNDTDQRIKDLSLAAIHNLAVRDTASMMVDRPALVLVLKNVLLTAKEEGQDNHEPGTPGHHASATLRVLERSITPEMGSYGNLFNLLEVVSPVTSTTSSLTDDENENEPENSSETYGAIAV